MEAGWMLLRLKRHTEFIYNNSLTDEDQPTSWSNSACQESSGRRSGGWEWDRTLLMMMNTLQVVTVEGKLLAAQDARADAPTTSSLSSYPHPNTPAYTIYP
ncbi:hypothetical protein R1flu_016658 [Riccia fluitans]|uniref:Uncharacterized protein n=1 Tax=Riccia fluitans TaxID=41844 RepID=A0ABD1YRC6_9MARC